MGATPYTPRTNYANMIEPQTSSTTTKRASTSSYESTDVMTEDTPLKKKHKVAHATDISRREPATLPDTRQKPYVQVPKVKTPKPRRTTARTPTGMAHRPVSPTHARSEPRQTTLIRRVQTVVEMPVKEEDDDDDPTELFSTSISASGSRSDAGGTIASRKRSTRLRARKQSRRVVDDEDSDAGSDVDDEAADSRGRGGDDDDDELRMGVEVSSLKVVTGYYLSLLNHTGQPQRIVWRHSTHLRSTRDFSRFQPQLPHYNDSDQASHCLFQCKDKIRKWRPRHRKDEEVAIFWLHIILSSLDVF